MDTDSTCRAVFATSPMLILWSHLDLPRKQLMRRPCELCASSFISASTFRHPHPAAP